MPRLPALRRVSIAGDRVLTVRRVARRDVGGIERLYDRLDDGDRYRRFFSVLHPDRTFFERLVEIDERGGAGVVAVVTGHHGGRGRIIGEAGYELLANGDGELAITVDPAWRGWLGPYLLDALTDVAGSRGVANLEAEVLLVNDPMLSLLRSRGFAVLPGDDWSVLRAIISTDRRPLEGARRRPTWPDTGERLRVLVEGAGARWHAQPAAAAAGVELLGCPGPSRQAGCPMVTGSPCPLVVGADVVVVNHPPAREDWDRVRQAHPVVHPGVPICVELRPGTTAAQGEVDLGSLADPTDDLAVVRLVERIAAAGAEGPWNVPG
jgi:GNAT superfamily N-acetyltransferase